MSAIVIDTHVLIWYLFEPEKLSFLARDAIETTLDFAHPVYISAISIVEIIYLMEKGRISLATLTAVQQVLNDEQFSFVIAPLDEYVAFALQHIDRQTIPDMPDRIIAATALARNLPLVTCDGKIRSHKLHTIW
jgi:PIN domain nuclease of toxin-antitoxin system